jgi:peptidoglycan/xylan/chitin deacetylase (PgdA/CDA1 family)
MPRLHIFFSAFIILGLVHSVNGQSANTFSGAIVQGGVIRGSSKDKSISLVFTGDEFFDGYEKVLGHLQSKHVKAGFFLTGRLYRHPEAADFIRGTKKEGHYLGPHSDMHLLYNDWTKRDSLLVSRDSMQRDLKQNMEVMNAFGIHHRHRLFIPPFEWWNKEVSTWAAELGWKIISFTPGTFTNADYTTPDIGNAYRSADSLLQRLFRKESAEGLNGAILLVHLGTDPRRTDKLYDRLPDMIDTLRQRGYRFVRIDHLIQ